MFNFIDRHRADFAMLAIVIIWGIHYVVVKSALSDIPPMAFQAVRFSLGLSVFAGLTYRYRHQLRMERHDFQRLVLLSIVGRLGYQWFFIHGLQLTTSTNTSLLVSTMPTWTALISVGLGKIMPRRALFSWIVVTVVGVALVVLGQAGAEFAISEQDLVGSGFALTAAILFSLTSVFIKPVVDRYGAFPTAIWSYWFTWAGLVILGLPELLTLHASDFPSSTYPALLYSGLVAGVGGYIVWGYAIQKIGPARAAMYQNGTPLVSALCAVAFLHEPLTLAIIVGGLLVVVGVTFVRDNMHPAPRKISTATATSIAIAGD